MGFDCFCQEKRQKNEMGIPVWSCSSSLSTKREIERRLSQKKVGDGGVEEASREG